MPRMIPLVDTHCHLLPAMDDGPQSWDEAVAMCQLAWDDGVRGIAATVHQNDHWPTVTPARIVKVASELSRRVVALSIPLAIYPAAEVMVSAEFDRDWDEGRLLSYSNEGKYLLIELPHGVFLDLRELVSDFVGKGVRPILAHPERQAEFLHDEEMVDDLIRRGCIMQVSAASLTQQSQPKLRRGIRRWARRRIIHLVGSDGHSSTKRLPGVRAAYEQLAQWEGAAYADRVCSANGMAVLEGLPLQAPRRVRRKWWPLILQ